MFRLWSLGSRQKSTGKWDFIIKHAAPLGIGTAVVGMSGTVIFGMVALGLEAENSRLRKELKAANEKIAELQQPGFWSKYGLPAVISVAVAAIVGSLSSSGESSTADSSSGGPPSPGGGAADTPVPGAAPIPRF